LCSAATSSTIDDLPGALAGHTRADTPAFARLPQNCHTCVDDRENRRTDPLS
jgi:hypothetical protein